MSTFRFKAAWASGGALAAGIIATVFGRRRFCVVCARTVPCFLPWRGGWRAAPPLMRELHMIGSDLDHFACPRCGCTDRDRHLRLYLENTDLGDRFAGARVLHLAPEPVLERWIESQLPARYVRGDLMPSRPGIDRLNLESLPFEPESFDIVIANHVLEHVTQLDRATGEIRRVLAHAGTAILQTPWCAGLARTIEDRAVSAPSAREQLYGQDDHVRLFGGDVFEQIGRTGLVPSPLDHGDVLPGFDAERWGVNPEEPLMLFRKAQVA
ncbi:methyltransferase domain-containing protein [Cognatilysobacter terrigena]|uniref:methyltransferase domain-containing protein n=1 Tax=Cognatilysobacter terrigena TaxID=2488749 RepID=UPI0014152BE5|nr:methyltransferase domain-containing protein [Lysobacter terrigena]